MHDGIVRTLTDVRHVPELTKNLISLGALNSNDYNYRASGRVMRIIKGALVFMKGLKQNRFYFLQGSAVTEGTKLASSSGIDSDTTKLWHMRLGHMSEKGMDALSKQELINRTLLEKPQCMLSNVELSKEFLAEAVKTAAYLVNRSPSAVIDYKTLEKKLVWFLISRDIAFDESSMLSKNDELIDVGKDHGASEKEELKLDVKTAFMHGEVEEQIFMRQPEGFVIQDNEDHVCLLKSLYGIKQSPRQWCKRFDTFMPGRGYTRSAYDSCVYHQRLTNGSHKYLLLYGTVMVEKIFTVKNLADMMTKHIPEIKFKHCLDLIGISSI
ncbi:hypothetical protein RJ639_018471 [Escallonia herrerae]|uniref:Uncharacterized protein n=1 Tax=Escallonia herrerae TaxID=1293975 RepID=A0AA89AJE3_9ASTE|nr:hypothetical protein RJ639_018471 [Escallonia herrerae]